MNEDMKMKNNQIRVTGKSEDELDKRIKENVKRGWEVVKTGIGGERFGRFYWATMTKGD